jgi:hypothetical protein
MQKSNILQESPARTQSNTHVPAQAKGTRILEAAQLLVPLLEQGTKIETHALRDTMRSVFQANNNEGLWQWKDACEACEAALIIFLQTYLPAMRQGAGAPRNILPMLRSLADLIPTHTRRSEDSQAFQQFSTPLELAFITAEAAAITETDKVLEPSAGTGMLAVHAHALQAKLVLNELAATRADMLAALFPNAPAPMTRSPAVKDFLTSSDFRQPSRGRRAAAPHTPLIVAINNKLHALTRNPPGRPPHESHQTQLRRPQNGAHDGKRVSHDRYELAISQACMAGWQHCAFWGRCLCAVPGCEHYLYGSSINR